MYNVFTNPDDLRMIAIDENGDGYMFTPDTIFKRHFDPDKMIYDETGGLWVSEELFGAEFDVDKMEAAWQSINEYWRARSDQDWRDN